MRAHTTMLIGVAALMTSTIVLAQGRGDRVFTATGTSCDQITWSAEALRDYPLIASACREVMERDGRYFVRFDGEVRRVADRGREVTIQFRDGDRLTLAPPENLSITINGRPTAPRDLRPGDELRFYIPQDQLAATFFAGQPETAPAQEVPISPAPEQELVAAAPEPRAALPRTASALPAAGVTALLLLSLGGVLTAVRVVRRPSA